MANLLPFSSFSCLNALSSFHSSIIQRNKLDLYKTLVHLSHHLDMNSYLAVEVAHHMHCIFHT